MDEDERYKRYVIRQWFKGKGARKPEDYRRVRDTRQHAREFGNRFRDGMCELLGRTEERGWRTEVRVETPLGVRVLDSTHEKGRVATEFKAGSIKSEALKQLDKDAILLDRGYVVEWYHTPGAYIDPQVVQRMQELQARYKERFKVIEVTREQFKEAIALGKELAKQREQQKKVHELSKNIALGQELAKQKEQLAKDVEAQNKQIEKDRKHGRALDADKLAKTHKDLTEKLDKIRDKERDQARDTVANLNLNLTKDERREMEAKLALRQEAQRRDVVLGLNSIAHTVREEDRQRAEREAAAKQQERERQARELADKQRTAALEKAHRDGIPPEILKFLALGQAEAPNVAVERGPDGRPEVTRGGRESMERSRELRRER